MKCVIFIFIVLSLSCEKLLLKIQDKQKEIQTFDQFLFPYILTSFMWHSDYMHGQDFLSTDQVYGKSFEWIRFRSAISGEFGQASDFCLGVKNTGQDLNLSLVHILPGQTCDHENNKIIFTVTKLKRALWHWPTETTSKKMLNAKLEFEWIENSQWKKFSIQFDLPHYPINHQNLAWGKTWRNQKPYSALESINPSPIFFIKDSSQNLMSVKILKIPHTNADQWQSAQVCFAVDDECHPVIAEQCSRCEKGYFTLYNTKCSTHGTTYCGEIRCGQRGQPACYQGKHHIKQDDFKGCSPFTEEWFCHQGLEIKCTSNGAVCY